MAVTPLSQAIMQGMDPSVYRPLQQLQTGDALSEQGLDSSPTSKWGALGRLAQSLAGTYISTGAQSDLAKTIAGGKAKAAAELMAALQQPTAVPAAAPQSAAPRPMAQAPAGQPQPAVQSLPPAGSPAATVADRFPAEWSPPAPTQDAAAAPAPPPASAIAPDYGSAIAKIESGGKYDLLGPVTKSGDRAYGKYQVMGANIPEWTRTHLGKEMTPQEFLASPEAQDGVFKGQFGQYAQKYGPEGAAKAWFAGEHGMKNPNAKDQLGTTVQSYADQFMSGIGGKPGPQAIEDAASGQPVKVAQAAPAVANDGASASPTKSGSALDVHKLLAVMQNPYADETAKAIAGKLLLKHLTPDEEEYASSPQGIYNKRTGELKQGQNAGNDFGDLRGRDLLAAVEKSDPAAAGQVKAIIEGRTAYPTGSRLNPVQQRVKELVTLVDPAFETGNSGARMKVRNEFLAGGPNTPAGQITAGNTAIQHLGHLLEASSKLGGASDWGPLNSTLNDVNVAIKGRSNNTGLVEYNNALGRFAEEATKFYRGVGGTESDIQRALHDLTAAQSPEARAAAIKAQAELMHSKVNALQDRWKQGMGPLVDEFPIIHPESKQALEKINPPAGGNNEKKAATESAPAGAGPAKVSTKAEYDALAPGATYIAPDGSTRTKK